jgi:hypothetical protein
MMMGADCGLGQVWKSAMVGGVAQAADFFE